MEDVEMEAPLEAKLEQSEAIMAAIIRSTKVLDIGPKDEPTLIPASVSRYVQQVSDRLVPWRRCRWISFFAIFWLFTLRVYLLQMHFFVAYVLAIYILNQLLLFISPATEDDDLPMAPKGGEFRPFVRALSEYKMWSRGTLCALASLVASCFDYFDVDVDPKALVAYFILLFFYTMKQQLVHMVKYRYVPWSGSKKRAEKGEAFDV